LVGQQAPMISYVDEDGKKHMISNNYGDATVIAITSGPCFSENSEIVKLSNKFAGDITVVEINLDEMQQGCDYHAQKVKDRGAIGSNIISLCDNKGLIRQKLQDAKPNTLFLLDQNGIIRKEGTISDLESFKSKMLDVIEESEASTDETFTG
ncbi:MAG: redoxin domain-containing protein, partial [Planctomycetes bacterium]|nr:redoxin domain-containing protein [Planctomycetota bacterium]